jgi:nitrogen-specific signal transduction histidine kinase/CheY-like chemotaxis protein
MFLADDITDQRKAEQALRQAQKLESLGVLAGGIAHDFNNLLTAVLGHTEVALGQAPEGTPLRAALEHIDAAAHRGADLARQLLAYAGKGRIAVLPQDLNRVIREMGNLLQVSISKKVALAYDLEPGLPAVEADSAQFQQVLMNLVINASEAIGDHPGTITLRTRAATYSQTQLAATFPGQVLDPGRYVRMEVADNGCGMDAETIGRIFDPFFSTKFTERGLGLSAMLGIVRGHQAGLRVESHPGEGTTFTLLFPASARLPLADPPRPAPSAPLAGRVLVADDEATLRDLARSALERAGLEVVEARDGQEAVERFQAESGRIHLVFLDLTMPRMGGAEAFRLIRQLDPAARVLLTSGYTEQEALDTLASLVPDGFLQKPFRVRDLVAKVQELLAPVPR